MIQKLKEWVNRVADIKIAEDTRKYLTAEDIEALEGLCQFATLAIESEGKWPMEIERCEDNWHDEKEGKRCPSCNARDEFNINRADGFNSALSACLAANASEKAEWEKKLLTAKEKIRDALSEKIIDVLAIGVANTYVDINKFADALANIVYKQLENAAPQKKLEGKEEVSISATILASPSCSVCAPRKLERTSLVLKSEVGIVFSKRTTLAGIKYEKLSEKMKDIADKLLDLMLGYKDD